LQAKKNSSAFPDFNLIEASATNNNTLAGFPAHEMAFDIIILAVSLSSSFINQ
jgi:hypothetical protein